jgi:hypothetical protein
MTAAPRPCRARWTVLNMVTDNTICRRIPKPVRESKLQWLGWVRELVGLGLPNALGHILGVKRGFESRRSRSYAVAVRPWLE